MSNEFDFIDLYLLVRKTKRIDFSSEKQVRKLGGKYPFNYKEIGKLSTRALKYFFKKTNHYKKTKIIDYDTLLYKTLIIKRKICYSDFKNGEKLKNLPGWNGIKDRGIYHRAHIIAKALGGKRIYYSTNGYYNGFIGTICANVGVTGDSGMLHLEFMIRNYIYNNKNNYILYECRVIYKNPKDKIPIFVVIIMISSDYTINKIYFVWNIQCGYTINYTNGIYFPWEQ